MTILFWTCRQSSTLRHMCHPFQTKNCPTNKGVVTALYAPSSSDGKFKLEALLCVDVGVNVRNNCNEEDPQVDQPTTGENNACSDGSVVVGAKLKQNFPGWIEKFHCCPMPTSLVLV